MSIYANTDTGKQDQIASSLGWSQVGDWIETLPHGEFRLLYELWKDGVAEHPHRIAVEIGRAMKSALPKREVEKTLVQLRDFLESETDEQAVVTINDGIEYNEESGESVGKWVGAQNEHSERLDFQGIGMDQRKNE